MKRILLSFTVLLLSSTMGFSQLYLGPSAGINFSNARLVGDFWSEDPATTSDGGTGFKFGARALIDFDDYVNFQFGTYINQDRHTLVTDGENTEVTYWSTQIPLSLVGKYPIQPDKYEIMLHAGAALGLGMQYKEETDGETAYGSFDPYISENTDLNNDGIVDLQTLGNRINRLNVSLLFGLQFQMYEHALISFDYTLGMSNMNARFGESNSDLEESVNDFRKASDFRYSAFSITLTALLRSHHDD